MLSNVKAINQLPIIYLNSVDSTNNYAIKLINADKSYNGQTIVTACQSQGKGQMGKVWNDTPNQSVLMSIILEPKINLEQQFDFLAMIANAVVRALKTAGVKNEILIKYPNDIIINNKKTGGILIENLIRGNNWTHAVVGIGINVLQKNTSFTHLPNATSLLQATNQQLDLNEIINSIRLQIIENYDCTNPAQVLKEYNKHLFKRYQYQNIKLANKIIEVQVLEVNENGCLVVKYNQELHYLRHGQFEWIW